MNLGASSPQILDLGIPQTILIPFLIAVFLLAELFLMNVEFRRQAHSLTMAGVPLVLGVLLLPSHTLVIVRLAGTLIAFLYQRIMPVKTFYNIGAYAFEAAADACLVWMILGPRQHADLWTVTVVVSVVALLDQFMAMMVLILISLHNGPMSRQDVVTMLGSAGRAEHGGQRVRDDRAAAARAGRARRGPGHHPDRDRHRDLSQPCRHPPPAPGAWR